MAIAFIDSVSASPGASGGTTGSIDTTGATLLVMVVGRFSGGSVSDSEGNTWTQLDITGLGNVTQEVHYVLGPSTNASHTFTYSGANAYPALAVAAYSGTDISLDQETTDSSTGTSEQSSTLTPAAASSVCICSQAHEDGNAASIDESYTEREDVPWVNNVNIGVYLADKILASAAAQTPTITGVSSVSRVQNLAIFIEDTALDISPGGITSGEAFGTTDVSVESQVLDPSAITSGEAFGNATVFVNTETVLPGGIGTGEAFGTAVVFVNTENLVVVGIGSGEDFGLPAVATQALDVQPSSIVSAEGFGSPVVAVDTETILPGGILSGEAFGTPTVSLSAILPTGIPSAEAFGMPTKISDVEKNFYGTLDGGNAYFEFKLRTYDWDNASNEDKIKALKHATKLIDRFNYLDQKYTVRTWLDNNPDADLTTDASQEALRAADLSQNNEFPRGQSPIVPDAIERATYLIAKALLSGRDPDADLEALAVKQSQYGGLKTTYQREGNNQCHMAHLIPSPQAFNMIRPFFRERDLFDVKRNS